MKRSFVLMLVFLMHSQLFTLKSQDFKDDPLVLQSMQGTWAFTKSGADPWYKVVIKGDTFSYYVAHPSSGEFFNTVTVKIVQSGKVSTRSNVDGKLITESLIKVSESDLSFYYVYLEIVNGKNTIVLGNSQDAPRLVKVASTFNPWK